MVRYRHLVGFLLGFIGVCVSGIAPANALVPAYYGDYETKVYSANTHNVQCDGVHDTSATWQSLINAVGASGGGVIAFIGKCEANNLNVGYSNVFIQGFGSGSDDTAPPKSAFEYNGSSPGTIITWGPQGSPCSSCWTTGGGMDNLALLPGSNGVDGMQVQAHQAGRFSRLWGFNFSTAFILETLGPSTLAIRGPIENVYSQIQAYDYANTGTIIYVQGATHNHWYDLDLAVNNGEAVFIGVPPGGPSGFTVDYETFTKLLTGVIAGGTTTHAIQFACGSYSNTMDVVSGNIQSFGSECGALPPAVNNTVNELGIGDEGDTYLQNPGSSLNINADTSFRFGHEPIITGHLLGGQPWPNLSDGGTAAAQLGTAAYEVMGSKNALTPYAYCWGALTAGSDAGVMCWGAFGDTLSSVVGNAVELGRYGVGPVMTIDKNNNGAFAGNWKAPTMQVAGSYVPPVLNQSGGVVLTLAGSHDILQTVSAVTASANCATLADCSPTVSVSLTGAGAYTSQAACVAGSSQTNVTWSAAVTVSAVTLTPHNVSGSTISSGSSLGIPTLYCKGD